MPSLKSINAEAGTNFRNRPTTHEHNPDTCTWLGCKASSVNDVMEESKRKTRTLVERELETEKVAPIMDFHMRNMNND